MHYRRIELCNGRLQQWDITLGSRIFFPIFFNSIFHIQSQFDFHIIFNILKIHKFIFNQSSVYF